ncbi:hypothetical protein ABZP36_004124 [Zizania latifolia]
MFVFGDSFVDTGNVEKSELSKKSRQWYWPYGSDWGDRRPTGRFSNAMVQSDLVAQILGRQGAPPTYRRRDNYVHPTGMNFAADGAGVYEVPHRAPTLDVQVDHFRNLVQDGTITRRNLRDSVALVAVSGNDYARLATVQSTDDVSRLYTSALDRSILVNNLHPVGCTPFQTRAGNYSDCALRDNMGAQFHNDYLNKKLNSSENNDVLIVDLHTAFTNIVNPNPNAAHEMSKQFKHKLSPCCESLDPSGYCGQMGEDGKQQYRVCDNPDKYFFWDDVHPSTDAGWKAVMKQLQDPITNFLGL